MRTTLRFGLLAVLFSLAASFALTADARADGWADGGSAPSRVSDIANRACGSSCAAPTVFDIGNKTGGINWPGASTMNSWRSQYQSKRTKRARDNFELARSRDLGTDRCGTFREASCPLWHYQRTGDPWGSEIHQQPGSAERWGDDAILAWNVRVWREGTSQPIFERVVCGDDKPGSNWQQKYWLCDSTDPGQTFTNGGRVRGPIQDFQFGDDKNNCNARYRDGRNGQRTASHDGAKRVMPSVARPRTKQWKLWDNGRVASGVPRNLRSCYWEGGDIGGEAFPGEFGDTKTFASMDLDTSFSMTDVKNAGGLKEAFWFGFSLPRGSSGGTQARFHYALDGAPGKFYAVQVIAINEKERQMPVFSGSPFRVTKTNDAGGAGYERHSQHQYFRVFMPNKPVMNVCCPGGGGGPGPGPDPDPDDEDQTTDEPKPVVSLDADSPLQSRERGEQNVDFSVDGQLDDKQAVFPRRVDLFHFTPQMRFNGTPRKAGERTGSTYGVDYIQYSGDRNGMLAPPVPGTPRGSAAEMQQPQMPSVSRRARASGLISQNATSASWLGGTLANPCENPKKNTFIDQDRFEADGTVVGTAWPADPGKCQTDRKNAWDDYFSAQMTWEARWVSAAKGGKDIWNYGRRGMNEERGELLRCNAPLGDPVRTDASDAIDIKTNCPWPQHGLYPASSNYERQVAQGFITTARRKVDDKLAKYGGVDASAARIKLYTNANDKVAAAALWDRDNGQLEGSFPYDAEDDDDESNDALSKSNVYQNPVNTAPGAAPRELNFCNQGLYVFSRIYQSSNPSKDDLVQNDGDAFGGGLAHWGDQDCSGFAVGWDWSTSENDCEARYVGQKSLAPSKFMPPTAAIFSATAKDGAGNPVLDLAATQKVASWGIYGMEFNRSQVDYWGHTGRNESNSGPLAAGASLAGRNYWGSHAGTTPAWSVDTQLQNVYPSLTGLPPVASGDPANPGAWVVQTGKVDPRRPPYTGYRPGEGWLEQACNKTVTGKWRTGHWEKEWDFTAVPRGTAANQRFVRVTDDLNGADVPWSDPNFETPNASDRHLNVPKGQRPAGAPYIEGDEVGTAKYTKNHKHGHSGTGWTTDGSAWGPWRNDGAAHLHNSCHSKPYDTDGIANNQRDVCDDGGDGKPDKWVETEVVRDDHCPSAYREEAAGPPGSYRNGYCVKTKRTGKNKWDVHKGDWKFRSQHQIRDWVTVTQHRYTRHRYSFGYWHYVYKWVWGQTQSEYEAGKKPDPYNCVVDNYDQPEKGGTDWDDNNDRILQMNETQAAGQERYAGPLRNADTNHDMGRTKFVFDHAHGGSGPSDAWRGDMNDETKYNATSDQRRRGNGGLLDKPEDYHVWRGRTAHGSLAEAGPDAQKCRVVRGGGRRTHGAWKITQEAQPGWGFNNTGTRLPESTFNTQFTFDNLSLADLKGSNPAQCGDAVDPTTGVAPRWCWSLYAEYDGRTDLTWSHVTRANQRHSDASSKLVRVFSPRNSR